MKVLMLLGRSTGGIGQHVGSLVAALRSEGHEVTVVTDASTATRFGWPDARLLWPVHPGLRAPSGLIDWHRIMQLARTVDVVHAHGHQAALVAAVAVARARPRPRLVITLHNDLPAPGRSPDPHAGSGGPTAGRQQGLATRRDAMLAKGVGWALRRADLVTVASPDLVDLARRLGARSPAVVDVAAPSVAALLATEPMPQAERAALLAGAGVDPGLPLVLAVSRIAPQKDLGVLVDAARRSRCPATWVVIGDGDGALRAELEKEADGIRSRPGAPSVRLVGARDDVALWLRSAAVFVLTSRWEARALVVQEAMAAGLPVVATRAGGLSGLVRDAGCLVSVGDSIAIAAEVDRLLGDPAERHRLGQTARTIASSWPTAAAEARRWSERYQELIGS
ncbi:glycosyltransferase [Intrasporangium mesophilum]